MRIELVSGYDAGFAWFTKPRDRYTNEPSRETCFEFALGYVRSDRPDLKSPAERVAWARAWAEGYIAARERYVEVVP